MTLKSGTSSDLYFIWDPYLNETKISAIPEYQEHGLVVSGGLWQARHLGNHHLDAFERQIAHLLADSDYIHKPNRIFVQPQPAALKLPIFLPVSPPVQARLDPEKTATLTSERTHAINARLHALETNHGFEVMWTALPMTSGHDTAFEEQGLHVSDMIASQQLGILLNRMCNSEIGDSGHYCCSEWRRGSPVQIYVLALAFAITLGWMLRAVGETIWRNSAPQNKPARACAVFAAVGSYCYLADRTVLFHKVNKLLDERVFAALCLVSLTLGVATTSLVLPKTTDTEKLGSAAASDSLPRQQTDEWKGWMQVVILLYHYFGLSRVIWVYRIIRLLVASYLFLTGYGHAQYFIHTNDFSTRRVIAVLVRLNLLTCVLSFFMGTTYEFYYFPALSSLWFVITWLTISKPHMGTVHLRASVVRLAISCTVMEVFVQSEGLQTGLFTALKSYGMLSVNQNEFAFRTRLDRFVPFLGMLTALLQHRYRHNPLPDVPWLSERRIGKEALMASSATLILIAYFTWSQRYQMKVDYNALHPFTAPIPIVAYVAARNATVGLRSHYSRFFAWFGRHSLETYILQYHIWLAADTKGLLRLGILDGWLGYDETTICSRGFWMEAFLITMIFLWVSSAASDATLAITTWTVASTDQDAEGLVGNAYHRNDAEDTHFSWHSFRSRLLTILGTRTKVFIFLLILWQLNLVW